jgi:hypothetical protein
MHAPTAKLESQRTAGSKAPREGAAAAGRTKLLILLYYCRTQETPGAPEGTWWNTRVRRDTKHRDTTRTGGHSGGIGRDTKRTGGNNGGIGAGRKATGVQQPTATGSISISIILYTCNNTSTSTVATRYLTRYPCPWSCGADSFFYRHFRNDKK